MTPTDGATGIERRGFLKAAAGFVGLCGLSAFGAETPTTDIPAAQPWISLFNGKDLTGWQAEGGAVWSVEEGRLVGKQGPGNAPGDLFTKEEYGDFVLHVVYRVQWPANSGVWFRYQSPQKAYQADILEYKEPVAYSGTLYCPGRMFLAVNKDPSIEKRDDWNTMVVHARGGHLVIRLNGKTTADVHDDSIVRGRIGFQVHAGDEFKDMKITVKEIRLRPLAAP